MLALLRGWLFVPALMAFLFVTAPPPFSRSLLWSPESTASGADILSLDSNCVRLFKAGADCRAVSVGLFCIVFLCVRLTAL